MNQKMYNLYESLIEFGYKDVTDDIDKSKGKKRIKKDKTTILFEYDYVYHINEKSIKTKL